MIKQIDKINISSLKKLGVFFWFALIFAVSFLIQLNPGVPLLLLLLCVYLRYRQAIIGEYKLMHLALLFLIGFTVSYFILRQNWQWHTLFIPFSLIPILITLLFNDMWLSLLMTLAVSVASAALSNNQITVLMLALTGGIFSSILVRDARKPERILQAGFLTGVAQVAVLILIDRFFIGLPTRYLILLFNGIACGIIVAGVLPVFEYLFNRMTNISLVELFDHPLLQKMKLEAPGTYHHSLMVGNLSESASLAVGANALLARIGAYYHDIGKLSKPEYFIENQDLDFNRHDKLAPTMSKLIIMNHVKEGVELGRKYKINPVILDFIQQHHGDSLVYYFYRRALESLEEDQEIKEEGFRYSGPKPGSKEIAIVLLADSVEAATRALKEPTPAKIEEIVQKVINNKFIDGQLDDCELTLRDLEKISKVFVHILTGIYHGRVTYPEEKRSENNHKKSSKEDSRQSEKDKKSTP